MVFFIMGGRSFGLGNFLVGLLCMLTITAGFSMGVEDSKGRCIGREREALLDFKQGFNDSLNLLSSWGSQKEEDCCRWRGIGCDNQTGHVSVLNLSGMSLSGTIGPSLFDLQHLNHLDLSFNSFGGAFPEFGLQHLNYLDLSFNNYMFRMIPQHMGSLTKLTYLNLRHCYLFGPIPQQLWNLSSLRFLDLSQNLGLMGGNLEWLSRLPALRVLKVRGLHLPAAVDWLQSIKKHPSLSILDLSWCGLPGIVPSSQSYINSSKSLQVLVLSGNAFNSSIFSWLFNVSRALVELRLSANELRGPIPDSFGDMISLAHLDLSGNRLEGGIPKSLWNLWDLQTLNLSSNNLTEHRLQNLTGCTMDSLEILRLNGNQLSGSVPAEITRFSSLRELYLGGNQFGGSFPKSYGNLSELAILSLTWSQLTGSLPDMTRFSSLRELYLDGNELGGSIPKSFGNLSELVILSLGGNRLNGSVPDIARFSSLRILNLGGNQLDGLWPKSVGQHSDLRILDVSSNSLNGIISEAHFSNLWELRKLDLSWNSLSLNLSSDWVPSFQLYTIRLGSCEMGPRFPNWLQTQKWVAHLDISNSGISDAIPNWFWNLTSKVWFLNLSSNHISGKVPNLSLELSSLGALDLSSNLFYGPIPPFLFSADILDLSKNKFSGFTTFSSTTGLRSASYLDLSDNQLSGGLPDFWRYWSSLSVLNLGNNKLSGIIPSSMGSLDFIASLSLTNNSFSGKLPLAMKNCSRLNFLDLGDNKFSGEIPAWIGESLTSLVVLRLRSNKFSGNIPVTICHLTSLQVLDLSLNDISGSIPPCLNNFTAMARNGGSPSNLLHSLTPDWISRIFPPPEGSDRYNVTYYDNALVVWKGIEREYDKILALLKLIDLSSNRLTGEVPEQVTSLLGLLVLNLSSNNLTGLIPKKIGQLKKLESLDLCRNQLSGGIPQSLADIYFLSYLNLSNNDLSGRIPSSTQLQSFNALTYMGNPQLCGPPLLNKCPGDDTIPNPPNTTDVQNNQEGGEWFGTPWTYASMAIGFTLGFWGVCGTLLLNSSWRHAYFRFLNDKWDWFYVTMVVNLARLQRRLQH